MNRPSTKTETSCNIYKAPTNTVSLSKMRENFIYYTPNKKGTEKRNTYTLEIGPSLPHWYLNCKIFVTVLQNSTCQLSCSKCKHTQGCNTKLTKHQYAYSPTQALPQVEVVYLGPHCIVLYWSQWLITQSEFSNSGFLLNQIA